MLSGLLWMLVERARRGYYSAVATVAERFTARRISYADAEVRAVVVE